MQVTKGTWHMREQYVPGSLSSSPAQEPGNEDKQYPVVTLIHYNIGTDVVRIISYINIVLF